MKTRTKGRVDRDPCRPIQLDLSCMMDGELDQSAVRRVLVHIEVCPRCKSFFEKLRQNVQMHRNVFGILERGLNEETSTRISPYSKVRINSRLARIFYELGKAYVLISSSPGFRREVAIEPVPIPEYRLRGRALLDQAASRIEKDIFTENWVNARSLLNGHLDSGLGNLEKGRHLLEEAVFVQPRLFEARIYLGHARNLSGDLDGACEEFRTVLRQTRALLYRGFALENLGNVYLQTGELEDAARCFRRVVKGDILKAEPRFFTSWFNLGLAYALQELFDDSLESFGELYAGYPGKRPAVRDIIRESGSLLAVMGRHPDFSRQMKRDYPEFFEVR